MSDLPSPDQTDFDNADANKIDSLDPCIIYSRDGPKVEIWNNDAYRFINGECPDTAHPSLWGKSQLCSKKGLYKVVDGIYQVRRFDISNMTFVETPNTNGVFVIDPLCSVACPAEALKLYQKNCPNKTIRAMIYTHSHADHFGGARKWAVVEAAGGKIDDIYAPYGFLEHAVSENVYAGNAMGRRAVYMYGVSLLVGPTGQIGAGFGMALSTGLNSLVAPTKTVQEPTANPINLSDLETIKVDDDLEIIFQITPRTEAPSEMNFYSPQYKGLCMAESAAHNLHNIQNPRGAVVRDARVWSLYMDDILPSSWTNWIRNCREFCFTESLNNLWHGRGYDGSISHNLKAIYNRYMGWFDGNPAHLWEHLPVATSQRYVKMLGAIENLIDWGVKFTEKDPPDLRFATTILSHEVFADQTNTRAKKELASVFTKLAYGAENATWRNFYLTSAKELLGKTVSSTHSISENALLALDIEQLMDLWALRINGPEAGKVSTFTRDVFIPDKIFGWHLNLSNGALTGHWADYVAPKTPPTSAATFTMWPIHRQLVGLFDGKAHQSHELEFDTAGNGNAFNTMQLLLRRYVSDFAIVTPEKQDI